MTIRLPLAAALLACAMPAFAATHNVAPGEDAQKALQEALILAEPGDEIVLAAGRYTVTDGLSLDVDNVTVRGAGMDGTVLDFTGQQGSGEGLLVTSDNVTLRDFALENPKGDGIKSKAPTISSITAFASHGRAARTRKTAHTAFIPSRAPGS